MSFFKSVRIIALIMVLLMIFTVITCAVDTTATGPRTFWDWISEYPWMRALMALTDNVGKTVQEVYNAFVGKVKIDTGTSIVSSNNGISYVALYAGNTDDWSNYGTFTFQKSRYGIKIVGRLSKLIVDTTPWHQAFKFKVTVATSGTYHVKSNALSSTPEGIRSGHWSQDRRFERNASTGEWYGNFIAGEENLFTLYPRTCQSTGDFSASIGNVVLTLVDANNSIVGNTGAGGETRGGGAGRSKYIRGDGSEVELDLINETDKTIQYEDGNGVIQTKPITDWQYDYEQRQYTYTDENGKSGFIQYNEDGVILYYGDVTYNYGYGATGDSGGTTDPIIPPDKDTEGESWWDWLMKSIKNAVSGIFDTLGSIIGGILEGIIKLIDQILVSVSKIIANLDKLGGFVKLLFGWLPEEMQVVITSGFAILLGFAIFKIFF